MGAAGVVVNGWVIVAHPLFLAEVNALIEEVERLKNRHPKTYTTKSATKRLAAIRRLALDVIPADPSAVKFRQGTTLGGDYRVWRRAKFFQQYRLFFRYSEKEGLIVLAWVNGPSTLRAYGSERDAYRIFQRMLNAGNPPSSWQELVNESQAATPLAPSSGD